MKPTPAFITAADLHEATGRSLSKSSAYRRARELGAVRLGRRLLVPITAVRREYGDEFAESVQQIARVRMEARRGDRNRGQRDLGEANTHAGGHS